MKRCRRKNTAAAAKKPDTNKLLVNESCRVCMKTNIVFIDIFGSQSRNIAEEIHYCTGLDISETNTITTKICCTCLNNLTTAHAFKRQCLNSDTILRQIQNKINEEIKEEVVEIDDDDDWNDGWNDKDDTDDDWKLCEFKKGDSKQKIEIEVVSKRKTKQKKGKTKKDKLKKEPKRKRRSGITIPSKCSRCNIEFNNGKALVDHNTTVHNEQETYICDICARIYTKYSTFDAHVRSHAPPSYFCDKCDYKTNARLAFQRHVTTHLAVKTVKCFKCEKTFNNLTVMKAHFKRIHEDNKKIINHCPQCSRTFSDKGKLKRHVNEIHDRIKRYCCDICSNRFSRREFWRKHMLSEHNVTIPRIRPVPGPRARVNEELLTVNYTLNEC